MTTPPPTQELTPVAQYRVPTDDAPPDGPAQLSALAQDIELTTFTKCVNAEDRDQRIPVPVEGQIAYLGLTDIYTVYDVATKRWVPLTFGQPPEPEWHQLLGVPGVANYVDTAGGNWQRVQYCKDAFNRVHFRGLIINASGRTMQNEPLFEPLPEEFRLSSGTRTFQAPQNAASINRLDVTSTGIVTTPYFWPANNFLFMDMVHYPAAT